MEGSLETTPTMLCSRGTIVCSPITSQLRVGNSFLPHELVAQKPKAGEFDLSKCLGFCNSPKSLWAGTGRVSSFFWKE